MDTKPDAPTPSSPAAKTSPAPSNRAVPATPSPSGTLAASTAPADLSNSTLLSETGREAVHLIRTQVELAKAELRDDLHAEVAAAKRLGVAAVAGLAVLNLLLVSGALALGTVIAGWLAALLVAAAVAIVGGVMGAWGWQRLHRPLERTRKALQDDVQWVKERTA